MLYVLILLLGGVGSLWGPWWMIAPVCFFCCFLLPRKPGVAFWTSTAAGVTLWVGYAGYLQLNAETALTEKVMGIFTAGISGLADIPAFLLMLVIVACISGLLSGFSGLAGIRLRQLLRRE